MLKVLGSQRPPMLNHCYYNHFMIGVYIVNHERRSSVSTRDGLFSVLLHFRPTE